VHRPEFALHAGKLRSLGSTFGFRMRSAQWKIAKHEPQAFTEMLLDLFYDRIGLGASRALIIAIFREH
jgi:hypothetical protein